MAARVFEFTSEHDAGMNPAQMHRDRVLTVVLGGGAAAILAFFFYQFGPRAPWFSVCWFHRLTGYWCPGCGMTRATLAVLRGHLCEAFRFNPLGMLLVPLALLGFGIQLIAWMRGQAHSSDLHLSRFALGSLIGLLLVFWILRNVPVWPFTLLAPP